MMQKNKIFYRSKIMKRKFFKVRNFFSLLILILLVAAVAFSTISCDKNNPTPPTEADYENAISLGEGKNSFTFTVTLGDGSTKAYLINTNHTIVGDALVELGLISGEDSQYGLMVFTVDGETHDYNIDQSYWAFYINGEYAMSGVDSTNIVDGDTYSFKVEK
jgi:hypothetical protein